MGRHVLAVLLLPFLMNGCALAAIGRFVGVRGAVAGAARAALASEAGALSTVAGRGLLLRSAAGGLEVTAEGAIASTALRTQLRSLAGRAGLALESRGGALTISGSRLVFDDLAISLRNSQGQMGVIGHLRGGILHEGPSGGAGAAVGYLRAVPRTSTTLRVSPLSTAEVRGLLKPGQAVTVRRASNGWYEVDIGSGGQGWVPAAGMAIAVVLLAGDGPMDSSTARAIERKRLLVQAKTAGDARREALSASARGQQLEEQAENLRRRLDAFLKDK